LGGAHQRGPKNGEVGGGIEQVRGRVRRADQVQMLDGNEQAVVGDMGRRHGGKGLVVGRDAAAGRRQHWHLLDPGLQSWIALNVFCNRRLVSAGISIGAS
jgi:hypothetical protein